MSSRSPGPERLDWIPQARMHQGGVAPESGDQGAEAPAGTQCRDAAPGSMGEPCSRREPDLAGRLREVGFYHRESIRRALATDDFGSLFWAARHALVLTQAQLGELLGLDQKRISQIERGQRPLTGSIQALAQITTRLGIPPALLGLCCCTQDVCSLRICGAELGPEVADEP